MYLPRFDVCRGIDQRIRLEFLPVCPVEWTDQTGAASASDGRSPARPLPRPPASVFTDIAKIRTKKKQTNKDELIMNRMGIIIPVISLLIFFLRMIINWLIDVK